MEDSGIMKEKRIFFLSRIQQYLLELFSKRMNNPSQTICNEDLVATGRSQDECDVIREICEDIDSHYKLMEELDKTDKTPEEWYEEKRNEIDADCTDEEVEIIDQVEEALAEENVDEQASVMESMEGQIREQLNNDKGQGHEQEN